jgi:hypothetical protein
VDPTCGLTVFSGPCLFINTTMPPYIHIYKIHISTPERMMGSPLRRASRHAALRDTGTNYANELEGNAL